jgi:hypothetical protein
MARHRKRRTRTRRASGSALIIAAVSLSACGTGAQHATTAASAPAPAPLQAGAARTPIAAPRPPVISAGPRLKTFSGTGAREIGSLSEKTAIVLQWSTSAPRFQLFTAHGVILLDSHTRTGRIRLAPGSYSRLHVASPASWTLLLRASA